MAGETLDADVIVVGAGNAAASAAIAARNTGARVIMLEAAS
jgi:tricarballylate dehydrogenase